MSVGIAEGEFWAMAPATLMFRSHVWATQKRRSMRERRALAYDIAALTRTKMLPHKAFFVGIEQPKETEQGEQLQRADFEKAVELFEEKQRTKEKKEKQEPETVEG